jgi:hypothetical protein
LKRISKYGETPEPLKIQENLKKIFKCILLVAHVHDFLNITKRQNHTERETPCISTENSKSKSKIRKMGKSSHWTTPPTSAIATTSWTTNQRQKNEKLHTAENLGEIKPRQSRKTPI